MLSIETQEYQPNGKDLVILEAYQHPVDFAHWVAYSWFILANPGYKEEYGWTCEPNYESLRLDNTVCKVKLFTAIYTPHPEGDSEFIDAIDVSIELVNFPLQFRHSEGNVMIIMVNGVFIVATAIPMEDFTELAKDINFLTCQVSRDTTTPVVIVALEEETFKTLRMIMWESLRIVMLNINNYQIKDI
jgi:hypothetical protein